MARPKSDIEDRILAAARTQFIAVGVDASSLRAIAREAGTSLGMIYYYYPNKDDLFLAVVEQPYSSFLTELEAVLSSEVPFEARILGFYRRISVMRPEEVELIGLAMRESMASSLRMLRLQQRFVRGHLALLVTAIQSGQKEGVVDPELHPLVVMAVTVGMGTLPQVMLRLARRIIAAVGQGFTLAPPMAQLAGELGRTLPEPQELAVSLTKLLLRAVGVAGTPATSDGGVAPPSA